MSPRRSLESAGERVQKGLIARSLTPIPVRTSRAASSAKFVISERFMMVCCTRGISKSAVRSASMNPFRRATWSSVFRTWAPAVPGWSNHSRFYLGREDGRRRIPRGHPGLVFAGSARSARSTSRKNPRSRAEKCLPRQGNLGKCVGTSGGIRARKLSKKQNRTSWA
jgi:hypothetical protein